MNLLHHPFAVRGRIEQCWLFVYREPVEAVRTLLPKPLALVTHGGFAFWNIVVCRLSHMGPPALPAWAGLGYWHVAYRLHARFTAADGAVIEGLFFVRSDCDRRFVTLGGNLLTDFDFHLAAIRVAESETEVRGEIASSVAAAHFRIDRRAAASLATGSPFSTLTEAANALEYRPAALSPLDRTTVNVVRVERDTTAWRWRPVRVAEATWQFLAGRETTLELCYEVEPIEYLWERGRVVRGKPCE